MEKNNTDTTKTSGYIEELSFKEIILEALKQKTLVISITAFFAVFSVIYSLMLPNIYRSEALLVPVEPESPVSTSLNQFGGIASFAGITLPSGPVEKSNEAIERIQSFQFFNSFILPNVKLQDLMATKKWDPKTNTLIYDDQKYDVKTDKWVREPKGPYGSKPSSQEAFLMSFKRKLRVNLDPKTNIVSVSIEHQSPFVAQDWLSKVLFYINESMREEDQRKASIAIEYLNSQMDNAGYSEIKEALSQLIQRQTQTIMLAEASEFYTFKVIDSPIVPELKAKPSRALICIGLTILGFIISILIVLIRKVYR